MSLTKNATLVQNAERNRSTLLTEALAATRRGRSPEGILDHLKSYYGPWVRELNHVNQYITVPKEDIDTAIEAYNNVAVHLRKELNWPEEAIAVLPQGSASTQTLIRFPGADKFDIDAVCQVDISRVDIKNPVGFFEKVGEALREYSANPKKRCWNIVFTGKPFYLEFTPSVPLATVSPVTLESMAPRFQPAGEYLGTALAVVDNPTKQWKTSNPAGFTKWVSDTAALQLIQYRMVEAASARKSAGVEPVPDQDVEITDTLRVAIRLFKRHRDMCIRRNQIEKEFKPISVIIVTLLTSCYAGLADLGRTYDHPVQLLAELAELMPGMVAYENNEYHVDNPTVPGENFAERWKENDGARADTFKTWCEILSADIRTILAAQDEQEIKSQIRVVFGCDPDRSNPDGSEGPGTFQGRRPPPPVIRTPGLA